MSDSESGAECEHVDFIATCNVNRLQDGDTGPVIALTASLEIMCAKCLTHMMFLGPMEVGDLPFIPTVNAMRDEIRLPLTYDGAPEGFGQRPGFRMQTIIPGVENN